MLEPLAGLGFVHKAERQMNERLRSGSRSPWQGDRPHQDQEAVLTKSIVIAVAALLLGAAIATPVQAQSTSFGIFFGDEKSDFFPDRITCMGDYQIRQAVAARGYTNIYLNVMNDGHVEVRATRDGWVYLLDFNYCNGRIEGRTQLRPAG